MEIKKWQDRRLKYLDLTHRLRREKADFLSALKETQYCQLQEYKAQGLKAVEILVAPNACKRCILLSNKTINIKNALKTMPIPVVDCDKGFCRCCYSPAIDY